MLLEPHMVSVREKKEEIKSFTMLYQRTDTGLKNKKNKNSFNSAQDYFYKYTGRTVYKNIRL